MCKQGSEVKAYGAGLLSSFGELQVSAYLCGGGCACVNVNVNVCVFLVSVGRQHVFQQSQTRGGGDLADV